MNISFAFVFRRSIGKSFGWYVTFKKLHRKLVSMLFPFSVHPASCPPQPITQCTPLSTKNISRIFFKRVERKRKKIWGSYSHLYLCFCADLRVLSILVEKVMAF